MAIRNLAFLLLLLSVTSLRALPLEDGVLRVGETGFYVGGDRSTKERGDWRFLFEWSPHLNSVVSKDPLVSNWIPRFFQTGIKAEDLINSPRVNDLIEKDFDGAFSLEGYRVMTSSNDTAPSGFYFFPTHSQYLYRVQCGYSQSLEMLSRCDVLVKYPTGDHTALFARQFFPGLLSEVGPDFEAVVHRLIEIAQCVEVERYSDAIEASGASLEASKATLEMEECLGAIAQ